jgi:hypothetical protein
MIRAVMHLASVISTYKGARLASSFLEYPSRDQADEDEREQAEQLERR